MKNEFARKLLPIGVVIAGSVLITGTSVNANALRSSGLHNIFGVVIAGNVLITGTSVNANALRSSGLHNIFDSSRPQFHDDAASEGGTLIGVGGKRFDAEHLQYNLEGNTLSIALPTGFNLINGRIDKGGKKYYAGDLALSFEGNGSSSMPASDEKGVDFGLPAMHSDGGAGAGNGNEGGGAYGKTGGNPDGQPGGPGPIAKNDGPDKGGLPGGGSPGDDHHDYYPPEKQPSGPDGIVDVAPVPEPATMLLFGAGLLGLGGVLRKRIKRK